MYFLNNSLLATGHEGDINNKRGVWGDIFLRLPTRSNYTFDGSITTTGASTTQRCVIVPQRIITNT